MALFRTSFSLVEETHGSLGQCVSFSLINWGVVSLPTQLSFPFQNPPDPTNDLLHSLMVEVCLVLTPDVNPFPNSRKQGLPCWHSLLFFFLQGTIDIVVLIQIAGTSNNPV